MQIFTTCVIIIIILWAIVGFLLNGRKDHEDWETLKKYRYAHRGLHDKPAIPENSMEAFRRAVEQGYGAELDVHLMKDGSLAVIHDSSLKRTAGADVRIEDLTKEDLEQYRLEGTEERIPLLKDVLRLFRGKTPLIIELKPEGGNHDALAKAVADLMRSYPGIWCVESFDPRVVRWFNRNYSEVCRGQLAANFFKDRDSDLSLPVKLVLTNLLTNFLTWPDFVAYRYSDCRTPALWFCRKRCKMQIIHWTLTTPKQLAAAEKRDALVIFENFMP